MLLAPGATHDSGGGGPAPAPSVAPSVAPGVVPLPGACPPDPCSDIPSATPPPISATATTAQAAASGTPTVAATGTPTVAATGTPTVAATGTPNRAPTGPPLTCVTPGPSDTVKLCVSQPFGDGDTVYVIHGSGFAPGTRITVRLSGVGVSPDHPVADAQGTFNYAIDQGHLFFRGPITPGAYTVVVTATDGQTASTSFLVNGLASGQPPGGPPGSP